MTPSLVWSRKAAKSLATKFSPSARPATRGRSRLAAEGLLERLQIPGLADDLDLSPVQHRHPGRVVSPVLQAPQPGQQDRKRLLTTGIADDPTHPVRLPSRDDRRRGQAPIVAAGP